MIGIRFSKAYVTLLLLFGSFIVLAMSPSAFSVEEKSLLQPTYVGSLQCKPCHTTEYENFVRYAKKSRSYRSIERLEKGLSSNDLEKCYACHTTGYGTPGGFVSVEKTPHLRNAGCEVCHGPGSVHVEDKLRVSITRLPTLQLCYTCHTSERIRAFRFTPLIHGGGH